MSLSWRVVSAVLDSGTGVLAGLNSLYFAVRLFSRSGRSPSRVAALAVLWLISLGAFVEAVVLIALASPGEHGPLVASSWTTVRAIAFVSAASVSALICRRLAAR